MTASELRSKYIEFFVAKGHVQIPSASLIPENDPTVLFTTAGMHPLVPFLMGEKHPAGKRLVNYQRCIRTGDIDLVGDDTHLTFFEMLGNWSLGDYFKKEAIEWSWEFLTDEKWLAIDPKKLSVSVFAGDDDAPRDTESAQLWKSVGVPEARIYYFSKEHNWWGPAGKTGPCGPDTEMFYDTEKECDLGDTCTPAHDCGRYVEIWNDVFMEYFKNEDGTFAPLKQKNVDTGMGLERTLATINGLSSVFQTELFTHLLEFIKKKSQNYNEISGRIISDHIKASVFLVADGILPSNKDQGYVLRRLIRRAIREEAKIDFPRNLLMELVSTVIDLYKESYPFLDQQKEKIKSVIDQENTKFVKAVVRGTDYLVKEIENLKLHPEETGKVTFDLYQTYGFPPELTKMMLEDWGVEIEDYMFDTLYKEYLQKHQDQSRKGAEQKFAGGLADHSDRVVRMHTATHLLHQALRDVLGNDVFQKGSNITSERLRFDFSFPRKVTAEELKKVEDIVNQQVQKDMVVEKKIIPLAEAKKLGAIGLFGEKYGDTVSVYTMGDYSKEFCGGPHVQHTGQVGKFKILKEEAVSAGVRRIKATVE